MLGKLLAMVSATSLLVATAAYAADNSNQGALTPGSSAGVKQAQSWQGQHHLLWLLGGGVVIGGVVLIAAGNGHGSVAPTCPLPGCTPPPPPVTTTSPPPPPVTTTTTTSVTTTTTTN
jgi:hypothetical protein